MQKVFLTFAKKDSIIPFSPMDMTADEFYTPEERTQQQALMQQLDSLTRDFISDSDKERIGRYRLRAIEGGQLGRDVFGFNKALDDLRTAIIVCDEMGMKRAATLGILLAETCAEQLSADDGKQLAEDFGADVARIVKGIIKTEKLYEKTPAIGTENFRNLLLSFADDMRVILIMIARRVNLMRQLGNIDTSDGSKVAARTAAAHEAAELYAPLAHKLGLYSLKSELEDLSMKYTETDVYYQIKEKLNQTKASRDRYIADFIKPIEQKMKEAGLKCHVKGRTKSIHSIWQKMKKQRCPFEGVYDLFAIRIILDSPLEKEKQECWMAYSLVTDMYQPNPKRLRDWLSIPKSNGYESLHTTVMGPEGKWVEVQIRTERMDDIAERGLAAHWRYKGIKSESGLDEWLTSIREALESNDDDSDLMDHFKMELYKDEVFVFTPKGDLFRLPHGATVLDFAYSIHTNLGYHCTGAKVNNRHVQLKYVLSNGDQVEILSSNTQTPKQGWLNMVTTTRARTKIRQALKEMAATQARVAREELERRLKNRKIELSEGTMLHLIKKMGYKDVIEFYQSVSEGRIKMDEVIEQYASLYNIEHGLATDTNTGETHSAAGYQLALDTGSQTAVGADEGANSRSLFFVDPNMVGIEYKLARCCNPVYGDKIFGFVTVSNGIKIHRQECPNANDLRKKYPYRQVEARWSGKPAGSFSPATLSIVGMDDIGIVNNITSVISSDEHMQMRSISIDTHDKLFSGRLTIMIDDTSRLESLIKKLSRVKGVKQVTRT